MKKKKKTPIFLSYFFRRSQKNTPLHLQFPKLVCVPCSTTWPWSMTAMEDAFWIVERRWAMMVQSLLHDFLAFWIQGRRGFVKQENLGVPDLGAGNSHTLLLKS